MAFFLNAFIVNKALLIILSQIDGKRNDKNDNAAKR
jgi:hypothetical protein